MSTVAVYLTATYPFVEMQIFILELKVSFLKYFIFELQVLFFEI